MFEGICDWRNEVVIGVFSNRRYSILEDSVLILYRILGNESFKIRWIIVL